MMNMDETPVAICDAPCTGAVRTGSKQPALVVASFLHSSFLTVFLTITASGKKLSLGVCLKGKTERCLSKIAREATPAIKRTKLYFSEKGKINTAAMLR